MTCRVVVAVAAVIVAAPPAAPAHAARSGVTCTFAYFPEISPGLSLTPSAGRITSDARGVADCEGELGGADVIGPGPFRFEGTYENGSCQGGGVGTGRIIATIPTYLGEVEIDDPITFRFGPGSGFPPGVGDWTGKRTSGRYVVLPTEGDCVSSPVTEAKGQGPWEIKG